MSEIRFVWWLGRSYRFHPNKSSAHRGFVYSHQNRVYGFIELTGLGWQFTSHLEVELSLAADVERELSSV